MSYEDWVLISTIGNTQSWDACLRTFTNRGDAILMEDYSFSSALEAAHAQGITTVPVQMDAYGIFPEALAQSLKNWVGPKPKMLYTICTGQNPTGSCINAERRREVYQLAQEHDLILIEDEPYFLLQMESYTRDLEARSKKHVHDHEELIKALVPSYLSMDEDGRVLRLDSVSRLSTTTTTIKYYYY